MNSWSTPATTFSYGSYDPGTRDAYSPISEADPSEQLEGVSTVGLQIERDEPLFSALFQRHICPAESQLRFAAANSLLAQLQEYPDDDGDTALHIAAAQENFSFAELLKNIYPDIFTQALNSQNNLGQTPLHLAVITQNNIMVPFFIHSGASVLIHEHEGRTAVHLACQYGNLDSLRLLLQCIEQSGPNLTAALNEEDYRGLNSLLCFIENNKPVTKDQFPVIDLLIQSGANPKHHDSSSGKSIVHYIAEQNNVALYEYLLNNYPSKIGWDAARYDGCQVSLEDGTFVFDKDE